MIHWLYPANVKYYDVLNAFNRLETFWPINSKVSTGDVVFVYLAAPYQQIGYRCEVTEIDLDLSSIIENIRPFFKSENTHKKPKPFMKLNIKSTVVLENNAILSYENLKQHGLNGMLMGPRKLENNPILLAYIKGNLP